MLSRRATVRKWEGILTLNTEYIYARYVNRPGEGRVLSIKYGILGLLTDGPLHGYELKAACEEELVPASRLNFGQVYTTLDRLQRDGLVGHEVVSQSERPDKKVYALTAEGRRQLQDWLATPSPPETDPRHETALKLVLARRLKAADPLKVVAAERRAGFERLREASQARARARKEKTPLATLMFLDLTVLQLEAFLKWLDRCEELLRKEK
jgi:DNA-binding PadR family transcriptional regulator